MFRMDLVCGIKAVLRNVAIIISRNGFSHNALKAATGILTENGKLIIDLNDNDIITMLRLKGLQLEHIKPALDILNGKLGFYPKYFDKSETPEEKSIRINKYYYYKEHCKIEER